MNHHAKVKTLLGIAVLSSVCAARGAELEITTVETAAISGFRRLWDTPIVTAEDGVRRVDDEVIRDRGGRAPFWVEERTQDGEVQPAALAFDALHRYLLVRFPDAAEQLAAKLAEGWEIERLELALPFLDEELWPASGYDHMTGWGAAAAYRAVRPTWHAIGYGLLKPWKSDPELGPTYNAYINGAGYWRHFGAQEDRSDRVDLQFGPTPVHFEHTEGRMDITAAIVDDRFGATLGERLRRLSDCGFLLRKWERYDFRYYVSPYEWISGTGPRAIVVKSPRLVATLKEGQPQTINLPPAADVDAIARELAARGDGGGPTAVMLAYEDLLELDRRLSMKPADLEDWQWERVGELLELVYGEGSRGEPFWYELVPPYLRSRLVVEGDPAATALNFHGVFVDNTLALHRRWLGYDAREILTSWFMYRDAMPEPVRENVFNYWTDWLMPDRDTAKDTWKWDDFSGDMIHPQIDNIRLGKGVLKPEEGDVDPYYAETGDWRGNKSFYRSGYTRNMSTVGFNNIASMAATLGGGLIGSEKALEDGRFGQSVFALKLWCWSGGSSQEEGDDFYAALALSTQKIMADFGADVIDRLMGKSMMLKTVSIAVDTYHPGLRRYVTGSSRSRLQYRLSIQDGLYGIMHTLSKKGVMANLGEPPETLPMLQRGSSAYGHDAPPDMIARAAASGGFAPSWYQQVVDEKPLPYEVKADALWGGYGANRFLKTSYLGRNYGVYTASLSDGWIPSYMIWKRSPEDVRTSRDFVTVLMQGGAKGVPTFVNEPGYQHYALQAAVQSKNKFIAALTPGDSFFGVDQGIRGFQASLVFFNCEEPGPTWEIYVDGRRIREFPAECNPGQVIAIKDGAAYMGVIPLPGSAGPGGGKVMLSVDVEQECEPGERVRPANAALIIDNVAFRNDEPFQTREEAEAAANVSVGFAVEMADADDYPGFEAFLGHLANAKVKSVVDEKAGTYEIEYASGGDILEMSVNMTLAQRNSATHAAFYNKRLVNGESPDLPAGVERASPFSLQSRAGTLELGGNTLEVTPGSLAVLQVAPVDGTVYAVNPLVELTDFSLKTADGVEVSADGKVGIMFLTLNHGAKTLSVEHAYLEEQAADSESASRLTVTGLGGDYRIVFNGDPVEGGAVALK